MGLEISEEFRPITPVRTASAARICSTSTSLGAKSCEAKEADAKEILDFDEDGRECSSPSTPKSPPHILKSPLVCPPAPKKPRPPKRKLSPPPQGFFKIPVHDLDSVFMVFTTCNSKKIRTA
ncbi:hypothetical protein OIU76_010239 [Salix suchowensis]|uniref:Uncharacterized protein n=1 Tax=Salix suchowensis TaxID=1278906 RepID=A0ABQ9BC15_9ROSI|nr:hypothetical protein IMY05_006G0058100 [Salix suchowensis]KAJ6331813.1 hypothetical protein OIU76_010239 [Salix suchowensis]KAJ6381166.1 hypothetical protein OIU77_029953 [Salix suchowensis]